MNRTPTQVWSNVYPKNILEQVIQQVAFQRCITSYNICRLWQKSKWLQTIELKRKSLDLRPFTNTHMDVLQMTGTTPSTSNIPCKPRLDVLLECVNGNTSISSAQITIQNRNVFLTGHGLGYLIE